MTKKWSSISSQTGIGLWKYMVRGCQKWKKKLNWTPGTFQYLRLKFWPFYIVKWPKLAIFNSMKRTLYATNSICFCFLLTSSEVDNEKMTMKRIEIIIFIILARVEIINDNNLYKTRKCSYLGDLSPKWKNNSTLLPSTFKVEENKVLFLFHFESKRSR